MIPRSMGSKYTHASVWMHSHRLFPVLWQIWNKLLFSNKGWQLHIRLVSTRCPNKSDIACTYSKVATKVGDTKLVAAWWNNTSVATCPQACYNPVAIWQAVRFFRRCNTKYKFIKPHPIPWWFHTLLKHTHNFRQQEYIMYYGVYGELKN